MTRTTQQGPMVIVGRGSETGTYTEKKITPNLPPIKETGEGWANKADVADTIAARLQIPRKRAMRLLDGVLNSMSFLLAKKRKVAIKGFGTFESKTRKGRAYKHPLTGVSVEVPDKGTVVFKPSKNLLGKIDNSR